MVARTLSGCFMPEALRAAALRMAMGLTRSERRRPGLDPSWIT